jgi:hypothetical protein
VALMKMYSAGLASGRFTKKGQLELRYGGYATPAQLGPAPAPDAAPFSVDGATPSTPVSGKNVHDAGIVTVQGRKRQNEQADEDEGGHRFPKKSGMGALNELALNFG